MKLKNIAITQRFLSTEKGAPRDALEQDYVAFWRSHGVHLHPMPNIPEMAESFLDEVSPDGILLSGGNDVHPHSYGQALNGPSDASLERDATEKHALDYALKHDVPVWAECRGAQMLNAFFGGRLKEVEGHVVPRHEIELLANDRSSWTKMGGRAVKVNSFHRVGFTSADLSEKLKAFARAPDGVIEGIFHPRRPIAGILWHPERLSPSAALDLELIEAFLQRKGFWQ